MRTNIEITTRPNNSGSLQPFGHSGGYIQGILEIGPDGFVPHYLRRGGATRRILLAESCAAAAMYEVVRSLPWAAIGELIAGLELSPGGDWFECMLDDGPLWCPCVERGGGDSHPRASRMYKKAAGQSARLCHMGHVLTENRNGLVVDATLTQATGTAERDAACAMLGNLPGVNIVTIGADKAYDTAAFVAEMRRLGVTPHVAQNNTRRRSAIDRRTTRHAGYEVSHRLRKRIEEVFGWMKSAAGFRKTRHCGTDRVGWMFTLNAAAYNLVRLPKLLAAAA